MTKSSDVSDEEVRTRVRTRQKSDPSFCEPIASDGNSWELVVNRKPNPKKAVLYVEISAPLQQRETKLFSLERGQKLWATQ